MILRHAASSETVASGDFYQRIADEGMIHASPMNGERYDIAAAFDPTWGAPMLAWCVGGTETYSFADGDSIALSAGGVLAVRTGDRYAYAADTQTPHRSRTLFFSGATVQAAINAELDDGEPRAPTDIAPIFQTGVFHPSRSVAARLNKLTHAVEGGCTDTDWFDETTAHLLDHVLADQRERRFAAARITAAKPATQTELARRVRRAVAHIHDDYANQRLNIDVLARTACLSRHHFIRCFSAIERLAPSRYLRAVRMNAAASLLDAFDLPISEVANAVGYADRTAFQRRFQAYFGQTPAARRART